jgi:uncharacterized small protein (DUF1192 family)
MSAFADLKTMLGFDATAYKAGVKEVTSLTSSFQKSISSIGGMIASAFSVGAVIAFTKSLLNTASQLQDTADAFGVGVESLQALKALAVESGVKFDEVSAALNRITKSQADALTGNIPLKNSFQALNISMADLERLSPDEIMQRIGVAIKTGGRTAAETTAAFELLGTSSGQMMGFLEGLGSQGIDPMIQKFKDLGMVIDESMIQSLSNAEDALERFKIQSQGFVAKGLEGMILTWHYLAGLLTGTPPPQAAAAAVRAVGGMPYQKKTKSSGPAQAEPDFKQSAEDVKWYRLMEQKLLRNMEITQQIAYYEDEINKLQKARAEHPADKSIGIEIMEREEKVFNLKKKQNAENDKMQAAAQHLGRAAYNRDMQDKAAIDDLNAGYGEAFAGANATGQGINVDSVARVGGSIGGSRPGMAVEDRAIKIQAEQLKVQQEFTKKLQELIDKQERDADLDGG